MIGHESYRSTFLPLKHSLLPTLAALLLSACGGGGGGGDTGGGGVTPSRYAVGGSVTGLTGSVVLQNNGETLSVSAAGAFRFGTLLGPGASYQVSVASQPVNQHCVVTAGSGVIGSADIGSVIVNCTNTTFRVGGTVSGLSGTLVLRNNDAEALTLTSNGNFLFPTALPSGSSYRATVMTQPADQQCSISAASGSIVSSDVSNIAVTCVDKPRVGGVVSGLDGTVVLQDNGADDLSVSADGSFTFARPRTAGDSYQVTVRTQPATRHCTVTSGIGTIGVDDVTSVVVTCSPTFAVSGTISGLDGPVVLKNGMDQITVNNDGTFTFGARLVSGASYAVSVLADSIHRCEVSSGSGTVGSADITNVTVTCIAKPARYRAESYAPFTSQNGVDNPEGTWVLLQEGTLSHGYQVAGINPRRTYRLWARAMVRIRRDPADPQRYFVLTCGPGGSRDDVTTLSNSTFNVPYYSASTSSWRGYGVTIVDATTMQRNSVSQVYSYTGNTDGSAMGWNLSWVLKRISDDPFSDAATVRDNLAGASTDATCVYESEGTYVATENDGTTETVTGEGQFFWTDAYPRWPSQLFNDSYSYAPRFFLRDEIGFGTYYSAADTAFTYRSESGDLISTSRSFSGASSSHSVQAVSADGSRTADDTLDVPAP
jgi:hypothetical protein